MYETKREENLNKQESFHNGHQHECQQSRLDKQRVRREMALGMGDGKEVGWTFSGAAPDYRRHCTVNEEEGAFPFVEGREGGLGEGVLLVDPLS